MTESEKITRLEEIVREIDTNLVSEDNGSNLHKWKRALLYKEARAINISDKIYGSWLKTYSTTGGRLDSPNVRSKLLSCAKILTEEQFVRMGYARAAELMHKGAWALYPQQMKALADKAHLYSKPDVKNWVKSINSGEYFVEPEVTPKNVFQKLDDAEIRIGILEGTYEFSDIEFFNPEFIDNQIAKLRSSERYAHLLFKFPIDTVDISVDQISESYRRLSMKYHPDRRDGSEKIMTLINSLRSMFLNREKCQRMVSEQAARMKPS